MRASRQDAWTEEDDRVLAEIILRHIQEGSTQLAAFEECAERLGRTAAACGYRWNACVRKSYSAGIELAKAQRIKIKSDQKRVHKRISRLTNDPEDTGITWNEVLRFLKGYKQVHATLLEQIRQLERDLMNREKQLQEMSLLNDRLEQQYARLSDEYETVKKDYTKLIRIMERARKLTLFSQEADEVQMTTRFRMEANGNLERID